MSSTNKFLRIGQGALVALLLISCGSEPDPNIPQNKMKSMSFESLESCVKGIESASLQRVDVAYSTEVHRVWGYLENGQAFVCTMIEHMQHSGPHWRGVYGFRQRHDDYSSALER